jgi:hypothetical protein
MLCVRSAGFGGPAPRELSVVYFRFLVSGVLPLDNHLLSTISQSLPSPSLGDLPLGLRLPFFQQACPWLADRSALAPLSSSKCGGQSSIASMLPLPILHPLLIQSNHQHSAGHFSSHHPLGQVELWRALSMFIEILNKPRRFMAGLLTLELALECFHVPVVSLTLAL